MAAAAPTIARGTPTASERHRLGLLPRLVATPGGLAAPPLALALGALSLLAPLLSPHPIAALPRRCPGRRRPRGRRLRDARRHAASFAERDGAPHRAPHPRDFRRDPDRGNPVLPRAGGAAADAVLGADAVRGAPRNGVESRRRAVPGRRDH